MAVDLEGDRQRRRRERHPPGSRRPQNHGRARRVPQHDVDRADERRGHMRLGVGRGHAVGVAVVRQSAPRRRRHGRRVERIDPHGDRRLAPHRGKRALRHDDNGLLIRRRNRGRRRSLRVERDHARSGWPAVRCWPRRTPVGAPNGRARAACSRRTRDAPGPATAMSTRSPRGTRARRRRPSGAKRGDAPGAGARSSDAARDHSVTRPAARWRRRESGTMPPTRRWPSAAIRR